jgi:hypothetical protein
VIPLADTGAEQGIRLAIGLSLGCFALVLAVGVVARAWDRGRIGEEIRIAGGQVRGIRWIVFGGGGHRRLYEVEYRDGDGNTRSVRCETSLLSGVLWLGDLELRSEAEELRREVAELREEVRRLEGDREADAS